jgi:hypothetical protein
MSMALIVRYARHRDAPPHTPQLSKGASLGQQIPRGDKGVSQHTPRTSITWVPHVHT